jgi:hypothetical protein
MLSNVVECCHRLRFKPIVHRGRPEIRQMFDGDPRCRTVARGPREDELIFRFNYWPARSRGDFDGHITRAAFVHNGVEDWYVYPECKLFVSRTELAIARARVGLDHFIVYVETTSQAGNPKNPTPDEWRKLLGSVSDLPLVHAGSAPCQYGAATVELGGLLDFREWMAVVCAADLAITTDTALMHVASAMGTPAVVLATGLQTKLNGAAPVTQPATHFVYPSGKAFFPVEGLGKLAQFDQERFSRTVRKWFGDLSSDGRNREDHLHVARTGDDRAAA